MDLADVSEEIRTALGGITGLRRPPWGAEQIQAPAAIVLLPDRINFDVTYGRGKDGYEDLGVVVLVGKPEERASLRNLAAYVSASGARSVKQVLEAYAWTTCESLDVDRCELDAGATYAGVPHLAAIFHLNIIGKGA